MDSGQRKVYIDLSKLGINQLPLLEMNSLQYLYLDNNKLTELPPYLFLDAPLLKWFDARNNYIEKIPESIKNHLCLETILLQNNKISYLPPFLCTVKSLRSIQLSGNPISYPKSSIIASGTDFLLKFLSFEYQRAGCSKKQGNDYNIIDVSLAHCENSLIDESDKCGEGKEINISESESGITSEDISISDEKIAKNKNVKVKHRNKNKYDHIEDVNAEDKWNKNVKHVLKKCNSNKYVVKSVVDPREHNIKIKENFLKDIWKEKRKEILNKREKILQDRRTLEALKNWRDNYKDSQNNNNRIYVLNLSGVPYDTDLNCVKILTRADIEKDLPDKYRKKVRCKSTTSKSRSEKVSLQKKIDEIIECMQTVDMEGNDWTPRTARRMISCEINRVIIE